MKSLCTALSREWHWNWQQILGEGWKFLEANSKYISQKYFKVLINLLSFNKIHAFMLLPVHLHEAKVVKSLYHSQF